MMSYTLSTELLQIVSGLISCMHMSEEMSVAIFTKILQAHEKLVLCLCI